MQKNLALITGASRGLGAALAEELAAAGWHVMAVARTQGALEELDDRIQAAGGSATLAPLDVTDPDQMKHLAEFVAGRWGAFSSGHMPRSMPRRWRPPGISTRRTCRNPWPRTLPQRPH